MDKIQKIKSKYEVHLADGTIETYETLERAEERLKSFKGQDLEYYFIRKDFTGKKKIGELLIS